MFRQSDNIILTQLRKRREHRREARAIWSYCLASITVWVAWLAVSLVYQQHYTHIKGVR